MLATLQGTTARCVWGAAGCRAAAELCALWGLGVLPLRVDVGAAAGVAAAVLPTMVFSSWGFRWRKLFLRGARCVSSQHAKGKAMSQKTVELKACCTNHRKYQLGSAMVATKKRTLGSFLYSASASAWIQAAVMSARETETCTHTTPSYIAHIP